MKKLLFLSLSLIFALNVVLAQDTLFSLNSLPVPDTGFFNGNDQKGFFIDSAADIKAKFYNSYDPKWDSWQGWAYSLWHNDTSQDFTNQWSVYAGYLLDSVFALAYVGIDWTNNYKNIPVGIKFSRPIIPLSVYVANTTYTALTIINSNNFSRAFKPGDFFKLIIIGFNNEMPTDTIVHYLADYRNGLKYVQKDWAYIDLRTLEKIDSLCFDLQSSDTGDYGMNTPGYFAIDMLRFIPSSQTTDLSFPIKQTITKVYPNPAAYSITVPPETQVTEIYNLNGRFMGRWRTKHISVANLPSNIYIVRLWNGRSWATTKVIIKH